MDGKKRVKNLRDKIFTFIAFSDEQPLPSGEMMKKFSLSKQALHYHLAKLTGDGFIRQTFRDYCAFYESTEKGKTIGVKKMSVGLLPDILGLHNLAFKFKILSGKNFKLKKSTKLRGWTKYHCHFDGHYVEKTPDNLIIWPVKKDDRMYGTDPFELKQQARDKAISIAQNFVDRYDLKLSKPEISRREHYALQSPLTKYMGNIELTTKEWKRDFSEGGNGEIEPFTPQAAIELVEGVRRLSRSDDRIEQHLERLTEQMAIYAEHLNAHIPVLKGMERMIKKLDKRLSQRKVGEFI